MRGALAAAWFASLGLTSWRTITVKHRPPLPSEVLATVVVFGGLTLLSTSDAAAPVAMTFGWGVVIAQVLGFFPYTPGTGPANTQNAAGLHTVTANPGQQVVTTGRTP